MSGNPDDSNYIHEQPTDTLNDSSSAALSSSTSEDEDVEGRLSSDSKIFERIKELGRRHGPLKPIRPSYRPSITSRRTSSVGTGVSDDTNGDEDEDEVAGKRESSGYVDLKALRRVLGNRLKERPLEELARSEEGSSTSSQLATGSITGAGSELPSAASANEEDEPPERTEAPNEEEDELQERTEAPEEKEDELQERTEAPEEEQAGPDDVSDETGFDGDQAAIGGSRDNEELSSRSQIFETQGSVLIAASQTTMEAPNSERKSIAGMQVSDTQGSISLVSSKSKRRRGGSEQVSTLSNSGSGDSSTSRMIMLPPKAVLPTKSKKDSHSRSKESATSRTLFKESDTVAETATSSRGASKGHSARMITSTPAAESHLSVSEQLGISAIARNHSSVSSIPSYVTGDTSSKEITTASFSDSDRTMSRSSVKKRLTFEGEKEGSREETKESSLTRTLDIDDIPGLEDEGNEPSGRTPTAPQVRIGKVRELASSCAAPNDRSPGVDVTNEALAADEQQGIRQTREMSLGEENSSEGTGRRFTRLSGNIAEDVEIIQGNVLPPAAVSEYDGNNDDEVAAQSFVSKVSDEQISMSLSTVEEMFLSKCKAAIAYAEENSLVVGKVTAKESVMGENIKPVRMLKMGSCNIFPQVQLRASERTAADEATARKDAADVNGSSRNRGEDSSNSTTSDSRFDPSKRFKRPRKLTGGSTSKRHPSEIYGGVISSLHKTSMSSSQGSRMGQSTQSQRDSTQPKDVLPSIEEPDDEVDVGTQSQSSQPPDRARLLPDIFPELLPMGLRGSPAASQVPERSAIHSGSISMGHMSQSAFRQAEQLSGPERSQLTKGSMESLFSEGTDARTPCRNDPQKENVQRVQEPVIERRSASKKSSSTEGSKGKESVNEQRSIFQESCSTKGSKGLEPVSERRSNFQESRSTEVSQRQKPLTEGKDDIKKSRSTQRSEGQEPAIERRSDLQESRSTKRSEGQEPAIERRSDLQESRSTERSEGQEPAIERRSDLQESRSTKRSKGREPPIERRSYAKNMRSMEGLKGQEQSATYDVTSTECLSSTEKNSAIPILKSHEGSNITRSSEEMGSNGRRTAEGLEQETVRSLTPHRNSASHSNFLLGSSPSLSRRSLYPAPEYSSDDESSLVRDKAEETRTKSVIDKHPLKQRRQSRMPALDSSSSEAELDQLEQHQKWRRSVGERRKRQSVHHSEASIARPPSSFRGAGDFEATLEKTKGTASSSLLGKFEETHRELRLELNVESRTPARGTPEASDGDDLSEPPPHANTLVVPAITGPNAISLSSLASQVEPSPESDESSDATITMSSFLEAQKRNKLSNNSSSTDRRDVVKATVAQIGGEAMEVDMLPPRDEVEEVDRVVVHMKGREQEERIEFETQSGSSNLQRTAASRKSKRSAASVKDILSVKQADTKSAHLSPVQESLREPVSPSPASPYRMRSRNNIRRPSHSIGSVRGDAIDGIAETPDVDQMDIDELPAAPVLPRTQKGRLTRNGLSLSNARRKDTARLEEDSEQDRGVPSAKTFTKSSTSLNRRSVNSKSKSQILEEDFDEVVDEILDEQEDIVNDEHFRQIGRTVVTSQQEDSVGRSGRLENAARVLTRGQREDHDSTSVRSMRSSSRKNSVATSVAPVADHPVIRKGEDTISEVRRKSKGEIKDAPLRMEKKDIEKDEHSRQVGRTFVTSQRKDSVGRSDLENDATAVTRGQPGGHGSAAARSLRSSSRKSSVASLVAPLADNPAIREGEDTITVVRRKRKGEVKDTPSRIEQEDIEHDEREDIENDEREDIEHDEPEDIEHDEPEDIEHDEPEDIENEAPVRQIEQTLVTSQHEDSVGRSGHLENDATALTRGQPGGHGSAAARSLRSSSRKSSVASLVAPLADNPAIREGEDTITVVRRKRKGEVKDTPSRIEQEDIENDEREDIEHDEPEDIENEEAVRQIERTLVTSPHEDSVGRSGHLENSATALTRGQRGGHDREAVKSLRSISRKRSVASAVEPLAERRATPEGTRTEARRKRKGQTMEAPERVSVEEAEEPEQPGPSSSRRTGNRKVEQAEVATSKGAKKTKRPAAAPTRSAPKKPKKNDLEALMRNDNLISTQLVRWKCEANNIRLNSNAELAEMTAFLNEEFEKMLNSLQRSTLREHGMFSFRELESALRSRGLIHGVKNELHCWFAQLLAPEDYKKAQGVLIPKGRDRDT